MRKHKRRETLQFLIIGLSLGAILLLAGGLPNLRFQPGKPLHLYEWFLATLASYNDADIPLMNGETSEAPIVPTLWSRLGEGFQDSFVIVFWLMLVFSIVYAIISPQFRRELMRMFIIILALVLLFPHIAKRMTEEPGPVEEGWLPGNFIMGETIFPEPPPFIQQPPGWLLLLAKILLLTFILLAIYLIWRRIHRKSDAQTVVVTNIRQALSNLESGSDFKDVVIACYAKMCQELQISQGVRRHQAMTPREFENHLARVGITSAHIRQLTLLFEHVRYGAKPTDKITEQKAIHSLQAIVKAYGE